MKEMWWSEKNKKKTKETFHHILLSPASIPSTTCLFQLGQTTLSYTFRVSRDWAKWHFFVYMFSAFGFSSFRTLLMWLFIFCMLSVCVTHVLVLDSETANRLEVVNSLNPTGGPSLLSALNSCQTAAGKRLLRSNLLEPMTDVEAIRQRLDAVEELASRPTDLHQPIKVRKHSHQLTDH